MKHSYVEGEFFQRYGNRDNIPVLFFSPGRVNLIGEHTDYNSGYVLPCALNFGTWLAIRPNEVNRINMASLNFDSTGSFSIETIRSRISGSWTNYPAGVINEFIDRGISVKGFDMLFYGDIPNGAGLSSSASIEMVTALAINTLTEAELDRLELVKLSQHAENHFVGMNCGIMDQFAVGFGRKNSALFLDCGTLEYEIVPFNPGKYSLIIANTNKKRVLTDSKYNERRAECEKAVEMLQPMRRISSLTDVGYDDLHLLSKYITDDTILRRARHVITENRRVRLAVEALKQGNLTEFGSLMNQSHDSLRADYEVTGYELDTMVSEARKIKGVIGTRMTGAGFGGCTVTLAEADETSRFTSKLGKEYKKLTGLTPDFYTPEIWDGAYQL
ncbi:MAG: galactokinase [Bacteroidales bacterium]